MPDKITDEERAAIETFRMSNGVTKVPPICKLFDGWVERDKLKQFNDYSGDPTLREKLGLTASQETRWRKKQEVARSRGVAKMERASTAKFRERLMRIVSAMGADPWTLERLAEAATAENSRVSLIRRILRENGYAERLPDQHRPGKTKTTKNVDWSAVVDEYSSGARQLQICAKFGISETTLRTKMKELGISRKGPDKSEVLKGRSRDPQRDEKIKAMYEEGASIGKIERELGIPHSTIDRAIARMGIKRRDFKAEQFMKQNAWMAQAIEMSKSGMTGNAIAIALGKSSASHVREQLRKAKENGLY